MGMQTPFFAEWRARYSRAKKKIDGLRNQPLQHLQSLFGELIPRDLLAQDGQRENSRRRIYTIEITFWSFLWQVLNFQCSCREVVRQLQSLFQLHCQLSLDEDNAGYCLARMRFPIKKLRDILAKVAERAEQRADSREYFWNRPVKFVDGTTVSAPDTKANQKAYPQPSEQKEGCGFPVIKIVGMFSLASGAIMDFALGNLHIHEIKLFRRLFHWLRPGDILLTDRGFSDYGTLSEVRDIEADAVCRIHQARAGNFRRGMRLGKNQRLVIWKKPPQRPKSLTQEQWENLPEELTLRMIRFHTQIKGFRTQEIVLITTLLDPEKYPLEQLAELYRRRWRIELYFRDIKTMMGMEVLRCKTPDMLEKELQMHFIAYNLIRCLTVEAAQDHQVPLDRISFKGTVDTVRHFSEAIRQCRTKKARKRLVNQLLEVMANDLVPDRPNRNEPRARKRRPKPYQYMTQPRHKMKETPHRGRKSKTNRA